MNSVVGRLTILPRSRFPAPQHSPLSTHHFLHSQRGFTLVEVLVAVVVLLITATAFVPLYVYIAEATQADKARLVATALAGGVMEEMRALPYDEVGTIGGNPAGSFPQTETRKIGIIDYTIETRVWWVEAEDKAGVDHPTAYKRVQITVKAPSIFTGQVVEKEDFRSLVAFEGEKSIVEAGHILMNVLQGTDPKENVKIDLSGGASHTGWTDSDGSILFGELLAGNYIVTADPGSLGMMARPTRVEGVSPSQVWKAKADREVKASTSTPRVEFHVDWPVYLHLTLLDGGTSPPTPIDPTVAAAAEITLEPDAGPRLTVNAQRLDGACADKLEIWWKWTYDLVVKADGYIEYRLSKDTTVPWDGTFASPTGPPGTTLVTVKILLTPATP